MFAFRFNFGVIMRMQRTAQSTPDMTEFSELLSLAGYVSPDHSTSAPDLSRSYSSPSATPQLRGFRGTHTVQHPSSSSSASSSNSSSASSSPYPRRLPFPHRHSSCPDVAQTTGSHMFTHAHYAQNDYAEDDFQRERSQSYDSLDSGDLPAWTPSATVRENSLAARGSPLPGYSSVSPSDNGTYSGWQEPLYGAPRADMSPAMTVQNCSASAEINTQTYYSNYHNHQRLQQTQQQQQYIPQQYHHVARGNVNQSAWVPGQYPCPDYQ